MHPGPFQQSATPAPPRHGPSSGCDAESLELLNQIPCDRLPTTGCAFDRLPGHDSDLLPRRVEREIGRCVQHMLRQRAGVLTT